jgi:hypothetical protein
MDKAIEVSDLTKSYGTFLAITGGEVGMDRDYTQGDDRAEGEL